MIRKNFRIQTLSDRGLGGYEQIAIAVATALPAIISMFSGGNPANNEFLDGLVTASRSAGFQGFTRDDVLHLMPGGWGSNYTAGQQQFQAYLNIGLQQPPGTNLVPLFQFGGGYIPSHSIIWTGNNVNPNPTPYPPNPNPIPASFGNWGTILLVGAGVYMLSQSGKERRR